MNDDLNKIVESRHDSPHTTLGFHRVRHDTGQIVIRTFLPHAVEVDLCLTKPITQRVKMTKVHPDGLFEAQLQVAEGEPMEYRFKARDVHHKLFELRDPYSFTPIVFDADEEKRFVEGEHSALYDRFGAHIESRDGCNGVRFGVWAPKAQRVSLVGNFNRWDGRCHPMQKISPLGIWELFIPDVKEGDFYKFEIRTKSGAVFLKTDPYAYLIEDAPEAAAIVYDLTQAHDWNDDLWVQHRSTVQAPLIYEMDVSRQVLCTAFLDVSDQDLAVLKQLGYSHIVCANFFDQSGDVASLFSPNRHLGTPTQWMMFIDRCHRHGLAVIIDVLPTVLSVKQHNLVFFDGSLLYEQKDKGDQEEFRFAIDHPTIRSLLISYVRFCWEHYHIDGFRLPGESRHLYRTLFEQWAAEQAKVLWLCYDDEPQFTVPKDVFNRLFQHRRLPDPFSILGPQQHCLKKTSAVRAILPFAQQAYVYFSDEPEFWFQMERLCEEGLWQSIISPDGLVRPYRLHAIDEKGERSELIDPYSLNASFIEEEDRRLFAEGNHYRIYEKLGAHTQQFSEFDGVNFSVWAPNAEAVSVVGDFNDWNGLIHPMRLHKASGIWELFIPRVAQGDRYQFEICTRNGECLRKSDPFAFVMETAPATESVVYQIEGIYHWHDGAWLQQRRQSNLWRTPISIYEVHLSSWMRGPEGRRLKYVELAERLIPYVKEMGFTHIEILPIAEHPYEPSWGYQVSNFYAPTARLGNPEELMAFIDRCHQNGIGVLLDWVAGHFPKDAYALAKFDGTHLYEHEDPRKGEHKDWGTLIFNYGRHEAENFLIANALFWLEHYHFDGLRVDAVASMLYLDYSRKDGEWIPNIYGGNENLEAIEFLKHTNYIVHERFPGVMMIAEESTAWPGVSKPTDAGGLGFGFKWNMGWMHDVLDYMKTPPEYRQYHHHRLTFVFHYAFEENFILSLSHDEVVHLKGSFYTKMPGGTWEKFANLRLLYFFMFTHPGKKLNFMGAEFGQIEEWNESGELQWQLLENDLHQRLQLFFKTLNRLYAEEPVLYQMDCRPVGFEWIEADNQEQSIIVFSRKARDPRIALIIVINFSAVSRFDYRIGIPYPVPCKEILNSNDVSFGGLSVTSPDTTYAVEDIPWHGKEFSITIDRLPALSALLLKPGEPDTQVIT